jgi:hypothetical protein
VSRAKGADLAAALDAVHACLTRFVVFTTPASADAATVYPALSHAQQVLPVAPRLVVKSPVRRCGKTRLLDVLRLLVANPLPSVNISAAALVRSITEANPPVIILDEADTTFGKASKGDEKAEHLRGILNAGFQRGWPYVRWDATKNRREECPTFAMAIIAGIGNLPDTITDRSVILPLRRSAPGERPSKWRTRRHTQPAAELGRALAEAVAPLAEQLADAEPDMPPGLNDRAEDTWEYLVALGDLASPEWGHRIRVAAMALAADSEDEGADSLALLLLADTRTVLDGRDRISSKDLVRALHDMEESPWNRLGRGEGIDMAYLARTLKPFGIGPGQVKIEGFNTRGYQRDHFAEAWARYLPPGKASCPRCGEPLDPALADAGIDVHPACEAAGPAPAPGQEEDPWGGF